MPIETPLPTVKKNKANPLPYVIIFAILFLVALGILTWVLDMYNKTYECSIYPNLWCNDDWVCTNTCTSASPNANVINQCFMNSNNATGLASCLYGPDSIGATYCLGSDGDPAGEPACDCVAQLANSTNSCLGGCPASLNDITPDQRCCCVGGVNCTAC